MPRTQQAAAAPTGMAYGAHQDAVQAQQQIPLPQAQPVTGRPPEGGGQGQPMPANGQAPVDPMQQAIGYARDFDPGVTPLNAPTSRPGEPVQAGLSMGPGPGPEIFSEPTRALATADVLTKLAQTSGNDAFLELASKIRGTGGMR